MENPNKIEIEGLKTIHKLCNFGAEHDMEGCSFTEIVERMFSKIEKMKAQVNTLDEMLLNQGEALAKAQAVPEGFVLIKNDTKTVVAIERMVEQQVEASGMDSRRLERLDDWRIIEAAIEAQEQSND